MPKREPTEEETRELIEQVNVILARRISAETAGLGIGFCLVLFELNDGAGGPGWVTYASNGQRDQVVEALAEIIDEVSAQSPQRGTGDVVS